MRIHRLTSIALSTLGVLAGGLALRIAPALGVVAHTYTGQQLTEAPPGSALQAPWGMTFDPSGNLFVADPGVAGMDEFSSEDVFKAQMISPDALSELEEELGKRAPAVAVDGTTGDVYLATDTSHQVFVFKPNGTGGYELLSTWANPEFAGRYLYVAVNNHAVGPSDERAGDVYVLTSAGTLFVLKPIEEGKKGEVVGEVPVSGVGARDGLAVNSATGDVYVAEREGHAVAVFNDKGVEQPSLAPRGSETPAGSLGSPTAVAVDESTGEVYVLDEASRVLDEFSPSGEYEGQLTGTAPESLSGPGSPFSASLGVAVQPHEGATPTKGDVYVSDGAAVDVFGPDEAGSAPAVSGEQASTETAFSEHLQGEVDPKGSETEFLFSYAKGSICTGAGAVTTPIGHAAAKASESEVVSALEPSTPYAFCMVVACKFGLVRGPAVPFTTAGALPAVEAGSERTSEVRSSEATLKAKVNPEKQESRYYFQASPAALGACPATPGQAGTGLPAVYEGQGARVDLTGLEPGTTYNYRVVAYNPTGVSCGPAETFTTQPLLLGASTVGEVTQRTATITATIDPGGLRTAYELDLGTSTAYGTPFPGEAGEGSEPVIVTFNLSGLQPGTTYHYRLLAGNSGETELGPDRSFTTAAGAAVEPPVLTGPAAPAFVGFTAPAFPTTGPKTKLARALEACRKLRSKRNRATCEKRAHRRYGARSKKATPKSRKAPRSTGANGRKR